MSDTAPRNPVGAPQMLADALLRSVTGTTALLRVTGHDTDTSHVGSGAGGNDLCRCGGEPGGDAKAAADMAGRRRVEVGVTGIGDRRGAAGNALDLASAQSLFAMTLAVTVAGQDYLIESIASNEAFGQVYLYRLLLREARSRRCNREQLTASQLAVPVFGDLVPNLSPRNQLS
jgi:hypothetical protein